VVIALFVVYHMLHLTWNLIHPGGASTSPYDRVVDGFQVWWVTLSCTLALLAVGFHLRHGIWSALANLGRNTSVRRRRHLNLLAIAVASRDHRRLPGSTVHHFVRMGRLDGTAIP
jgi:succinate dehydrogenase / fumarate reductase, cytochrome b subunit